MKFRCSECNFLLDEEAFMDPIEDSEHNVCNGCIASTVGICSCGYRWQEADIDQDERIFGPCPVCGDTEGIDTDSDGRSLVEEEQDFYDFENEENFSPEDDEED